LDVKITLNQTRSYGAKDNSNSYDIDTSDVGAILSEGARYTGRAELTEEEKKSVVGASFVDEQKKKTKKKKKKPSSEGKPKSKTKKQPGLVIEEPDFSEE